MNNKLVSGSAKTNIILLANRPRMLREMMHRVLRKYPETHHVFELENGEDVPELLNSIDAHWLVVSMSGDNGLPTVFEGLMDEHPDLGVVAVSEDGRYLEIYRTLDSRPEQVALYDISLNDLLELLGSA